MKCNPCGRSPRWQRDGRHSWLDMLGRIDLEPFARLHFIAGMRHIKITVASHCLWDDRLTLEPARFNSAVANSGQTMAGVGLEGRRFPSADISVKSTPQR
jgi:hypothetical protein